MKKTLTLAITILFPSLAYGVTTVPVLISPANWETSVPLRPTFTWHGVDAPDLGYCSICFYTDAAATYQVGAVTSKGFGMVDLSYTPTLNFLPDTQYYWRIQCNFDGAWADWSEMFTFHTVTAPPPDISEILKLNPGWNLVGATISYPSSLFQGQNDIISVWKWKDNRWSVLMPGVDDGGSGYANSHGFGSIDSIAPGEGFWVNLATPQ